MPAVDINRLSAGYDLPKELSGEIMQKAQEESVVQRVARRMNLPGRGVRIPIVATDATASFVEETGVKPVSRGSFASKYLVAKKIAFIEPFSQEFLRDASEFYNVLVQRAPGALAQAFDRAALFGEGAPSAEFDTLAGVSSVSLRPDAYKGALSALSTVSASGEDISAFVLSAAGEIELLGATDTTGRPLFTGNVATDGSVGSVLGRPVVRSKRAGKTANNTIGFAGDFAGSAVWGQVGDIRIDASSQATIVDSDGTTLNLWQRNMVAIRVEVEVGFTVLNPAAFVRLTNAAA